MRKIRIHNKRSLIKNNDLNKDRGGEILRNNKKYGGRVWGGEKRSMRGIWKN